MKSGVEVQRANLPYVGGVLANLILIPKKRHLQVGMHTLRYVKGMIEFGTKIRQGTNLAKHCVFNSAKYFKSMCF